MMKLLKFTIIFLCPFVMGNTKPWPRLRKKPPVDRPIAAAIYHPNLTTADLRNSSEDIAFDPQEDLTEHDRPVIVHKPYWPPYQPAIVEDSPILEPVHKPLWPTFRPAIVEDDSPFYDLLDDDPIEEQQEGRIEDESPSLQPDVCLLPAETGPCKAAFPRFWYNSIAGGCEKFIYGGCFGNGNNFETYEECVNFCPYGGFWD